MDWLRILIAILASYFIGSTPTAYLAGKLLKGIDIRQHGSGNVGATNVARVVGKGPGLAVFIIDILKGLISVTVVAYTLYGEGMNTSIQMLQILCCFSAIAGHNWTVFLRFRGGKGMATSGGALLGIAPLPFLICLGIWAVVFFLTRIISVASLSAAVALPFTMMLTSEPTELIIMGFIIAVTAVIRHRSNIKKLIAGAEEKFRENGKE